MTGQPQTGYEAAFNHGLDLVGHTRMTRAEWAAWLRAWLERLADSVQDHAADCACPVCSQLTLIRQALDSDTAGQPEPAIPALVACQHCAGNGYIAGFECSFCLGRGRVEWDSGNPNQEFE